MTNDDEAQWAVVSYCIDAGLADVTSNALATIGFHDFTISSRIDKKLDLICYGRGGTLPPAVLATLAHLSKVEEQVIGENTLIASADDRAVISLCPDVQIIPEDPLPYEPSEIPVYLGRGPAFGDGRHPTTRSAARLIRPLAWADKVVWDVGAGSGVLGLLAWRLGASRVIFGDIDDDANRTCRRSCALNGYTDAEVIRCDLLRGFREPQPDVIIANIYAELVDDLLTSPEIDRHLIHGTLILAGISHHKAPAIRQRLAERGFRIDGEEQEEWWYAFATSR